MAFIEKILTPPHPLTNFEIQGYYQNEPRFNWVFSRDNLPNTIKNGASETSRAKCGERAYVINLNEYRDIGTHWVALYVNNKTATYFDSFRVEHIPKEIMKFIGSSSNKKIITNIYRIQAYDSTMCGYFRIGFINFMFNGNSLIDYTSLFSPNEVFWSIGCKMSNSNLEVSKANRANETSELNDLTKFRLDEINKIKYYLNAEIKERKDNVQKISKYIVAFDYADKLFITLSASYCITCNGCWNTGWNSWSTTTGVVKKY